MRIWRGRKRRVHAKREMDLPIAMPMANESSAMLEVWDDGAIDHGMTIVVS